MTTVEYSSNNSGGDWWLDDDDWRALEQAGWEVNWYADQDREFFSADAEGRWMGALAANATREGLHLRDAILEWERVTGKTANDLGCSCCGPPHSFYAKDDEGKWTDTYSPEFPAQGERTF